MNKHMILFLLGKDRPGIVDELSKLLFDQGANIEDSRMAVLGGCFCIMALFSFPMQQLDGIKNGLKQLEEKNRFQISLHETGDLSTQSVSAGLPLAVNLQAMDHPGIVNSVVHVLHQYNANILSLTTQVINAPLSGAPLFDLSLKASVPDDVPIAKVKADISKIAEEMNLDVDFRK